MFCSAAVSAPVPAEVVRLARSCGAGPVFGVRRSVRSFSGWVCVCSFAGVELARRFAAFACREFQIPFCALRSVQLRSGRVRFRVSVPVLPSRPLRLAVRSGVFRSPSPRLRRGQLLIPFVVRSLPVAAREAISSSSAVGFSGSRSPSGLIPAAVISAAVAAVPSSVPVSVGCQRGVDAFVRAACDRARVFQAIDFGSGRGAYAARSVACVRSIAIAGGLWVAFPVAACPDGLMPSSSSSRCFSGTGSGTWASLAFAVGLGVRSLLWLPRGISPPPWGFEELGGGWYFFSPVSQLSLF